jgi:hypothetical protein
MKKITLLLAISIFAGIRILYAQQTITLPEFNKVIVSNGILLQIETNPGYLLQAKFQDCDSSCLLRNVKDKTLTLKIANAEKCKGKVMVTVNCQELAELQATGKAEVSAKSLIKRDSLILVIKSNAQVYIDFDIMYLKATLSEGGLLKSEGYAVKQDISVNTSATFSGYELEGDVVNIETTMGAKAKICATEQLKASAWSNSYISYKCDPKKKTIDSFSGGTVEEYKVP